MKRLHRSEALALCVGALRSKHTIAVTGTCGKTSVTSALAETLFHLGKDPGVLAGGLVNAFRTETQAGNFRKGNGDYFVLEADESDKSLLNYSADSALVLNIGTDHYSKEELARVFGTFLSGVRSCAVVELQGMQLIRKHFGPLPDHLQLILFSGDQDAPDEWEGHKVFRVEEYHSGPEGAFCRFSTAGRAIRLPGPGKYQALNALGIYVLLRSKGFEEESLLKALESFHGTWRRFDPAGSRGGVRFYDDYAHNVEKIISCLEAAHELTDGKVIALFQPHGYGPLGFMRHELFKALEKHLRKQDLFGMLNVYYAGGSSSFTPESAEVIAEYRKEGKKNYIPLPSRQEAGELIRSQAEPGDIVLVMGARDNSLSSWAKTLPEFAEIPERKNSGEAYQ
ncbi:MAG: hypothetical protein J6S58_02465 [Lentisphaeria bacterium]|nr:hypothetical protein [Lentisphaeria bacterium]